MPLYQLILSTLLSQLLAPPILGLALTPQEPPVDAKPIWPPEAPPFPWAEQECRHPRFPNFYLTFTWGQPLPRDAIYATTQDAEDSVRQFIRDRMGSKPVPSPRGIDLGWNVKDNIVITVRPYKKYMFSKNRFSFFRASDAEQLIGYCGLDSQVYKEMWAFVFHGPQQIGYIWLARSVDRGTERGNAPVNRVLES
ncbi:MAG: hypothetical protein LQ343_005638 [Gyalolechia ehrenbergii]|nr:MAG: hypothetical protein LQ343_005638 [Gyalolechia ehrenbergii]